MSVLEHIGAYSAHVDTFARDNLPPADQWPLLQFGLPELDYPERVNCAAVLIDGAVAEGHGNRIAIYSDAGETTYEQLQQMSNRLANVLVRELGVVPGNRVLLRGSNCATLCAAWLAVMKAGAIAVTTMPMLRAKELGQIATKAHVDHALCDVQLLPELIETTTHTGRLAKFLSWGDGVLEAAMARQPQTFDNVDTSTRDVCVLAFTSGTTGSPKATMHFHRDVLAMCDTVARHLLETAQSDIYAGQPALGLHIWLGLAPGISAAFSGRHRDDRAALRTRAAFGHPALSGHLLIYRTHHVQNAGKPRPCVRPIDAQACGIGRRAIAGRNLGRLARSKRHSPDRWDRRYRDDAHLHLGQRRSHSPGCDR